MHNPLAAALSAPSRVFLEINISKSSPQDQIFIINLQGWTLAPARPPMVRNFHGGQVKFDITSQAGQALFPKSLADPCYGQVKDWLVSEKVKIQP